MNSPATKAALQLGRDVGFQVITVPYNNFNAGMTDFMQGLTHWTLLEPSVAIPLIRSGRVKPIVAVGEQRVAGLNLPTVAEVGFQPKPHCNAYVELSGADGPIQFNLHEFMRTKGGAAGARSEVEQRLGQHKQQARAASNADTARLIQNLEQILEGLKACS